MAGRNPEANVCVATRSRDDLAAVRDEVRRRGVLVLADPADP